MRNYLTVLFVIAFGWQIQSQENWDQTIDKKLTSVLWSHKELVGIPNLPQDLENVYKNISWVKKKYQDVGFQLETLESSTLPVLFAERMVDPKLKTILFYFHLDGQPVNPDAWDQEDPFVPVLKEKSPKGDWKAIAWDNLNEKINDDWRIFGRAAADDKAPITMMLSALEILKAEGMMPKFNLKIIFDLEEEYGSNGFLSTLKKYKSKYASDYMIIMDGPAHNSNQPTLTFGCRGIATCSITAHGAKLPQHSGHYGNYVSNPVFTLSRLLSTMKGEDGRVLIDGYYDGISLDEQTMKILTSVPDDTDFINKGLIIKNAEKVGTTYQEALQYPSLNVRQIGTSWKGKGLKTVIPEYATAHIDVRLVKETDGAKQLEKVKKHIEKQGFYVIDRNPTDKERMTYDKIVTFKANRYVNAFRTDMNSTFGATLSESLTKTFGKEPVRIRTMGGTVPIIPAINELKIPAIIVPMVNMDNNQHSPNENIRIGNIRQGIKICLSILNTEF
ncbi:MAG: acetylornithine deacetylase [Flavobacteriaceae bacterium]|nr:acetylornithine deacetylase [Flavobacteriaceae bacterium]|tara:strand:- start:103249 stop:104754 length:1506 start_codon:yes stop_codon:yes gene_type:complete